MTRELACLVLAMDELDGLDGASLEHYQSGMGRVLAYLRGRKGRRLTDDLERRINQTIQQYDPKPPKTAQERRRAQYLREVGRTENDFRL